MCDNSIKYANGFSLALSRKGGEAGLTFFQTAPSFHPEKNSYDGVETSVISSIVIPYDLLIKIPDNIKEVIAQAEAAEKKSQSGK